MVSCIHHPRLLTSYYILSNILSSVKSYSLRNTCTYFCDDVVCNSEDGTDNSADVDIYLMKYCLPITYHVVPRSIQTKSIYYSTNILIQLCFQQALWVNRLALSSLLSFQLCDSMGFFSVVL